MKARTGLAALAILAACAAGCVRPGSGAREDPPARPLAPSPTAPLPSPSAAPPPTAPAEPAYAPPSPAAPAPDTPPDSGWEALRDGLERRTLEIRGPDGQALERLSILRLDPACFAIAVAYQAEPKTLETWLADSGALIALNGGFYRAEGETLIPTGLTIVGGEPIGESYGDFAGMLAVGEGGANLRWLAQTPYDPAEGLVSALQSFPLLVKPGGELGFPAELEDNQAARRTVIAQDRSGRFLFLVAPRGYFTLHQLSAFLTASDLELDIALNLDGGPSSGLLLADPPWGETALLPLPVVILIDPR